MTLESKIEAVLFFKGEPVSRAFLAKQLEESGEAINAALESLSKTLENRGVALLVKDDEVELRTSPGVSSLIEKMRKEELERDLSKASLETLSIILYRGPITRADIDFIRGVNSTFILRSLLVRGLIERISDPNDERKFLYRPTFDLLGNLGISKLEELPEYSSVIEQFKTFEAKAEALSEESAPHTNESGN